MKNVLLFAAAGLLISSCRSTGGIGGGFWNSMYEWSSTSLRLNRSIEPIANAAYEEFAVTTTVFPKRSWGSSILVETLPAGATIPDSIDCNCDYEIVDDELRLNFQPNVWTRRITFHYNLHYDWKANKRARIVGRVVYGNRPNQIRRGTTGLSTQLHQSEGIRLSWNQPSEHNRGDQLSQD